MKLGKKFLLISLPVLAMFVFFIGIEQLQGLENNVAYDTLPPQEGVSTSENQIKLSNIQALVSALPGADVNVSSIAGNEAEVSIDVNPTNPDNQVIAGHSPEPNFTTLNTFYTTDGGQNWTLVALGSPGTDDGLISTFRFDPTVAFDENGNVYVAYGAETTNTSGVTQKTVVVAKSTDGGQTYTQFTQVDTNVDIGNLPGNDKWHLATGPDPNTPAQQNVYIAWTKNVTEGTTDQRIVVSVSTDGGVTFTSPVIINDGSISGTDSSNLYADPAVGPNGELYVSWNDIDNDTVLMDVSLDGGTTFGKDITVTTSGTGFKTSIPSNPSRGVFVGPTIDVDRSGNSFNGRLYITYTDVAVGGLPDTDIFVRYSDDDGTSWSGPTLVNDDVGSNSQFLPWLDVDQQTGVVAVVWYDARNDTNNQQVEVFMAVSDNGGVSFLTNILVSDGQSDQSFGNTNRWAGAYLEYIGIAIIGCQAFPVWSDNSTDLTDLDFFTDHVQITGLDTLLCNQPPDCNAGDSYAQECAAVVLDGTGSSDPEGNALSYSWATDCTGGVFDNANSATPTLTVSPPCNINCNVTLTVTDSDGLTSQCTATVSIDDTTPPVITCPSDVLIECNVDPVTANTGDNTTVTDNCDPDPVISFSDVEVPGSCPQEKTITRTWTATDACGNSATCDQIITVVDTTAPIVTNVSSTIIPPDAPISFTATAIDNCDDAPTVEIIDFDCFKFTKKGKRIDKTESCDVQVVGDTITILNSGGVGDHIVWTVIATDACGNVSDESTCEVVVVNPAK